MSFDRAQFIKDFEEINGKANKGQTYSAPVVVQPRVATAEEIAQQQAYTDMQKLIAAQNTQAELDRVNRQINNLLAVQGRDNLQRQQLNNLVTQKKTLNTQLGNPSQKEILKLSGEALVKNIVASPFAAADMMKQVSTDPVEMEIQALERKAGQGVLDAAGWERLRELKPQQYTKALDTSGWSWQKLQEARQAQEQASKGMDGAEQFLYNTGMSMATNIATLPANIITPGASLALMGTQSMADKALEVAENGGSAGEALGRGLASGGIEVVTELASLGSLAKIFKGSSGKAVIEKTLESLVQSGKVNPYALAVARQSATEGGEELVSAIANYAVDKAVGDPNAQLTAEDLVLSFLGGAISGGVMGGGASLVGNNLRRNDADSAESISEERTTIIDDSAENHTAEEMQRITEYKNSVDNGFIAFIKNTLAGKYEKPYKIADTTDRAKKSMMALTGLNKVGDETVIDDNAVKHIEKRHGVNGEHDNTMSYVEDIARAKYVLDNYDEAFLSTEKSTGYSTKNGKPAPIVMFQKKLNGNYVVVEAVSDAKKNKNFVVSMYISKDGVPQNKIAKAEQQPSMANDNVVGRDTAEPLTADTFTNLNIPQPTATDNGNVLQSTAKTAERKALEDEVKRIVGIDTRTEAEKVAQEQQHKVVMAQEWADKGIAPQEDVERLKASAAEKVKEAKAKESLDYAVELIEYAGKEADIYSDSTDRAAAYNTAKRIGINLAHNDTTELGRAVHEVGHDKTATKEWAEYTAALDRVIATDGRLVKLMEDIDYAYRNSEDAEVRASVSFEDGSIDNSKIREEQYLKLTEIMLPNIAKGDKQLLDAIKKDRNVLDNLLDFIRGIKNKVSIKLTKSEAAMLDEAERQLVNLLRSEGAQAEDGKRYRDSKSKYSANIKLNNKLKGKTLRNQFYTPTIKELQEKPDVKVVKIQVPTTEKMGIEEFKSYSNNIVNNIKSGPWFNKILKNNDSDYAEKFGTLEGRVSDSTVRKNKSYKEIDGKYQRAILYKLNEIFENAVVIHSKPDGKEGKTVSKIHTLLAAVEFSDGKKGVIKLNVKEYYPAEQTNKIHENKILEIKNDFELVDGLPLKETEMAISSKSSTVSVANLLESVKNTEYYPKDALEEKDIITEDSQRVFSLAMPVEETKDLVAVHNLNEEKLASALKLGGLPSPSIAIIKAEQGHEGFGDITMVFNKDTIDPKNKKNKVYGSDAWTPTKPSIEYEVDTAKSNKFDSYIWNLSNSVFDGVFGKSSAIASRLSGDGTADNYDELVAKLLGDDGVKAAYIAEKGISIEPEYKATQYHRYGNEALDYIKEKLGAQKVAEYAVKVYTSDFSEQDESNIRQLLTDYWIKGKTDDKSIRIWTNRANKLTKINIEDLVLATERFIEEDGSGKSNEIDKWSTLDKIDEVIKADKSDFENWIKEKTAGVIGEAGIYNGKDPYTAKGDRRDFWELHNAVTLENLVKAMNSEADRGVGMFGGGAKALQATATPKYSSIDEIKADKNRLKKLTTEEHEAILEELDKRIDNIVRDIQTYNNDESYMSESIINDVLVAAAQTTKTPAAIIKVFKNESAYAVSNDIAKEIQDVYKTVAQIPVSYFEAKPQRAVGFEEVKAVLVPENTSATLKQQLAEKGMPVVEYNGTEQDRVKKLNSLEDVLFSLQSDIGTNEYWGENSKSRAVERHAVNEFASAVADLMGVEFKDKNEVLKKQAWKIADVAKKTGVFDTHQMIDFFENAYNIGKQETGNLDQRNKALKKELHNLGIKPLKGREYIDFVQKYKGKIMFNRKGLDIDVAYKQLCEDYPDLFSEDIVNPHDMMRRIGEVYDSIQGKKVSNKEFWGQDAEKFKSLAMQQYQGIVDNFIDTMNSVSRYQLALAEQRKQDESASKKVYTIEDVKAARELAQPLMKEIARMNRKNLFTPEDRNRLNEMLKLSNAEDVNRMQEGLRQTNPLAEDIIAMYDKKKMLEAVQKPIFEYNKQRKARLKSQFLDILQTSDSWKDKGSGLAYMNNTFERNIDDIVTDKKAAEELKNILPRQIHKHVADATRYKNKLRDKIRGFNIDTEKVYNIEVQAAGETLKGEATEADLIQMYGEGIVTKQYLDKIGADTKKIVETADKFREIYNELFEKINDAYVANGYAPMEYRQDYFPHFFDETGDTLLNKVGAFLGFDAKNMLPTEIAGRTHEFSPGRQWNSHALQRKGEKTDYNVLKGFDNYIEAAANIIHLTEDIQNLRAFENAIRYKYSDEGMKAELDAVDALPISESEKQEQREKILKTENRNTKLNNFVVWEHEYTNLLAGKKSKADRWIEDMFGRRFYTVAKNIENRVSANMIAGNISSALTNIIPITQLTAEVDVSYIATAMSATIKNMKKNDGFVDMSDFLTNRFGSEMLSLTNMQKAANIAGKPMELVDEFTSNVVTRARYLQNVDKNKMDSGSAIKEADEYAASLMADRSKGALPTIFESKNPLIKLFTMFQVEQANQLNYLFKDLPRKKQDKAKNWLLWAFIKLGIFSFLYNWMFEQLAGRKPAFSPVDMIYDTGKDVVQVAKGDKKASAALSASFVRTMENLPYASSVLAVTGLSEDAGRIPVSGALPDFSQLAYLMDRDVSADKKKAVAMKELTKPALYLAAPFAGGAAKKVVDTAVLYGKNDGVQYSVQSDGSKKVQFANDPSVGAVAQSALFGKWASKPAQEYIDSGFKGLTKGQTKAFEALKETGIKNSEAVEMVKGIKEADTNKNGTYTVEEAKTWLNKQNLTRKQKEILFICMCPNVKNNPYK